MYILRRLDPIGLSSDADFVAWVKLSSAPIFCLTIHEHAFLLEERFDFSPGAHQVDQLEQLTQGDVRGIN